MGYLPLLALLVAKSVLVSAQCPHEDQSLQRFSSISGNYDKSSVVTINVATLLDVELLDVDKVIVEGSGKLVLNRGHETTIKLKGMHFKDDAAFVIGSQACPHTDQVNIYLEGTRTTDRASLGPEGDKFIMVTDNASLQIFGQDKMAWTKLASTVERFDKDSSNIKFRHLDSAEKDYMLYWSGLAFSVFSSTLERRYYGKFVYSKPTVAKADKQVQRTVDRLDTLVDGDLVTVTISSRFNLTAGANMEALYARLEQDAGMPSNSLALREARLYDAWALAFVYKGNSYDQSHHKQLGTKLTRAVAAVDYQGYKVSAVSVVKYKSKTQSYDDIIILNPEVGYPEISVLDDISSWNIGDEILLTSTDYAWEHAEVRRIKDKKGTNTLVLGGELYYRHFGEIEDRVDMRGEVALITRNIKVQGVMSPDCPVENGVFCDIGYDTYGGHIKIQEGFGSVHIEGMEVTFMGQTSDRGFYPIHFHMCRNITGKTAIVRRNSIHHTFRRFITVHGTFGASETALGVKLIENVGFDGLGHGFFLEDGAEMATLLERNLGATVRGVKNDFKTDQMRPAVFWITNPKVIMVGNVATGSQSMGIWYTFPLEPVGPSAGLVYAYEEAKHTKIWRFENNVVHSNGENGMFFDRILDNEDGEVRGCMQYEALENPLDENSPYTKSQLIRLTAYKNRKVNTWLRGGYFEVIQYSSAESMKGMHIARGSPQQMFVRKSIIIGESVGNHEDSSYPDGLNGASLGQYLGAVIHDGPTYYDGVWFQGFKPSDSETTKVGAIGFSTESKFTSSVASTMTDLRFGFTDATGGNRVFDGDVDESVEGEGAFDSQETATFRDGDGSVTGCQPGEGFQWSSPTQLVVPEKYALTENCVFRENWNLAACNDKYGKMKVLVKEVWAGEAMDFDMAGQMKRHDLTNLSDTAVEDWGQRKTTEYMGILGSDRFYYSFQFLNDFPKKFQIEGRGIERDAGLTVGVCMPENAVYGEDYTIKGVDGANQAIFEVHFVDTLDEVMADIGMYRLYQEGRFVYMRLHSNRPRDSNWDRLDTDHCSGRMCPRFVLEFNKDLTFTPCFTPTAEEMSSDEIMPKITRHTCSLPAKDPESDWGAGDTTISDVDGQWGTWSSWADCCFPEGETRDTTRFRVCDNPPQYGNGADCAGDAVQTEQCKTPCPVDGVMTEYGLWGDCFCDGEAAGSYGAKSKTRECTDLAHGGKICWGARTEYRDCEGDCGDFPVDQAVDGVLTEWSSWGECFCDGVAAGSYGASMKTRECTGVANGGTVCRSPRIAYKDCIGDCGFFPED